MRRNRVFPPEMNCLRERSKASIADNALQDNDILGDKLTETVLKLSEDNAKAISKGLFRYAVQLEMVMRVLAELSEYTPEQVEEMRREAINNVRRTRGKVRFEDVLAGYYDG